jgi:hypothetical protein
MISGEVWETDFAYFVVMKFDTQHIVVGKWFARKNIRNFKKSIDKWIFYAIMKVQIREEYTNSHNLLCANKKS